MTADAFHARGLDQWRAGDHRGALESIGQAIALAPGVETYRNSIGVVLASMGEVAAAAMLFRSALVLAPGGAGTWANLGHAIRARSPETAAIPAYARALAIDPSSTAARASLAGLLRGIGAALAARRLDRQGIALAPDFTEGWSALGSAMRQADPSIAFFALSRASAISPGSAEAHNDQGILLFEQNRRLQALAAFDKALRASPLHVGALTNSALTLQRLGRSEQARTRYTQALSLDPAQAEAHSNLAALDQDEFDHECSILRHRRAIAIKPSAVLHSGLLFTMCGADSVSNDALFAEARRWEAIHARPFYASLVPVDTGWDPGRRLRVGWCSADLNDHPVAHNVIGLIEKRDRHAFASIVYADLRISDGMTQRFRQAVDSWREIGGLTDATVADMMRADGVDILVMLAGHTLNNRIGVAARKPAPIQISFHDLTTSGLEVVDGWLTDRVLHPDSTTEIFTEQLIRMPCFYLHRPRMEAPEPGPPPMAATGAVTFGSLNNPRKYNASVFAAWARILDAIPASRFLMKYVNAYESVRLRDRILSAFAVHGVPAERIVFVKDHLGQNEHLAVLQHIDIALDPFPFNGSTTTFEALWMGVPPVTLAGKRFVGRVGASVLSQLGLTDLIAEDVDGYVDRAVRLASDLPRLISLRRTLRDRVVASSLCDGESHARALESVFRGLWRNRCAEAT